MSDKHTCAIKIGGSIECWKVYQPDADDDINNVGEANNNEIITKKNLSEFPENAINNNVMVVTDK